MNRQVILAGICCFATACIITLIVVLSIELAPVPLADSENCKLDTISNSMILQEQLFSWGYQIDILTNNGNTIWGYIISTINYNPTKNTYQMKTNDDSNDAQVTVTQNLISWTTNFEYEACSPYSNGTGSELITYSSYKVAETIEESFVNSLSGIYTTFNIYKNNVQIATSNKLSLIDTNMQIIDNNGNILATMTRTFLGSLIVDKWIVTNYRPDVIDNWVVAYIPALVTIKKREYQNNNN